MLDMGKLESGEVVLEEKSFHLQELLNEVLTVIEKLAQERGIEVIKRDLSVTHWNLIGSAGHLKHLLMNIMGNAVKYNKDHGKSYSAFGKTRVRMAALSIRLFVRIPGSV